MNTPAADDITRRLCAVLGHELRNPLAAAMTSLTVASEMTDEVDPRAVFLRRAERDLERLSALLTCYLEFGRGVRPERTVQGLGAILDAVRSRWSRGVQVASYVSDPRVHVDARLLGRALDNLIDNAFRVGATRVDVRVQERDTKVEVVVDDDGPGVEDALRDRIFEPFVSGRGSTGLGLAIARETIRAHDGRITCTRSARGACFRIELPLYEEEGVTA